MDYTRVNRGILTAAVHESWFNELTQMFSETDIVNTVPEINVDFYKGELNIWVLRKNMPVVSKATKDYFVVAKRNSVIDQINIISLEKGIDKMTIELTPNEKKNKKKTK